MSKKPFLIAGVTLTLLFFLLVRIGGTQSSSTPQANSSSKERSSTELPDHVRYMFLFRHIKHLNNQAELQQLQGKQGSGFKRRFQEVLTINADQFERLTQVALSCESELAALDRKAQAIVEAFRAQYPPGQVPRGVKIPPPPAELNALQEERNRVILRARDQLKFAMGEEEFTRLDEMVRQRLTPGIKRISPK